jgi:hypothetical protein
MIYYNDGHHFHGKRVEPPVSIHKLHQPVDEVLGTSVDLLVLGLGYGDVYFHDSKVGRVVGDEKEVWESFIDWRIMRMVQVGREKGTDQVREVIRRGKATGLTVFPSLRLQDVATPRGERCGWLRWRHEEAVCHGVNDPRWPNHQTEWAYDFTNQLVWDEKKAMVREMLVDYEADGIELDFMFFPLYFRMEETADNIPTMNRLVEEMRGMVDGIGEQQGRKIPIMARVHADEQANLDIGLDVATWVREGNVDMVVGSEEANLIDTVMSNSWLPDVANRVGVPTYYRPARRIYDHRVGKPDTEMFRALSQTLHHHGWAGIFDGYYPWPFGEREYEILREIGYPDAHARRNKRYALAPREGTMGEETTTPDRQIPVDLVEGETARIKIFVPDDLESAKADGELRKPILNIRFSFFCIEDEIEIRFNGRVLPIGDAEITDERALRIATIMAGGMDVQAPFSMSAHFFKYVLELDDLVQGENTLEVETKRQEKTAGFTRSVNGVDIQVRYKQFERPQGLTEERIAPA